MYQQGNTWQQISEALKRSAGAVQTKLHQLYREGHPTALAARHNRRKERRAHRELLGLLMAKGVSAKEIAKQLNLTEPAVNSRKTRYLRPSEKNT